MIVSPLRQFASSPRGFSLVEVLLAILILGIGIVSIAALFPAGIAQQRLANDDVMGPIVANSAISIIRAKVRQEDFGTFEEYQQFFPGFWSNDGAVPQGYFSRTIPGDWDWMRPGFLLENDPSTGDINAGFYESGSIDIFSYRYTWQDGWNNWNGPAEIDTATELPNGWPDVWTQMGGTAGTVPLFGIPYNTVKYSDSAGFLDPPNVIISQRERYYPMQTSLVDNEDKARPQYVWDCMFRRYQGRVYVAIFVYRVSSNNPAAAYVTPANMVNPLLPPLPYRLNFTSAVATYATGVRDVLYDNNDRAVSRVLGSENVATLSDLDSELPETSWQRTRQWLLDQNNNVHRVVGIEHDDVDDVILVELTRPLQPVLTGWWKNDTTLTLNNVVAPFNNVLIPTDTPTYYRGDPSTSTVVIYPYVDRGVLTDLWYIPHSVEVPSPTDGGDPTEFTLTPVYVTVKEL